MKRTRKIGLQILLLLLILFALTSCGDKSIVKKSGEPEGNETDLEKIPVEDFSGENDSEMQDTENIKTIDDLWAKLDGVWRFQEYIFNGEVTEQQMADIDFRYIDGMPCMINNPDKVELYRYIETFFHEFSVVDEDNYNVYFYKKGSYNGEEGANWGADDTLLLIGYAFDLSNISDGELSMTFCDSYDYGVVGDYKERTAYRGIF